MRPATLVLVFAAGSASAQEPVPDTTAPWRYFPLDSSNTWEYRYHNRECPYTPCGQVPRGYRRWTVTGDTAIGGVAYRRLRYEFFDLDLNVTDVELRLARFDSVTAQILDRSTSAEVPHEFAPCPLDRPFTADGFCNQPWSAWMYAGGQYNHPLADSSTATGKRFFFPHGRFLLLAADIGMYELRDDEVESHEWLELLYARSRSRTYGVPYLPPPVAVEDDAPSETLHLEVAPNPSDGPLWVTVVTPRRQSTLVEVVDLLGRRVYRHDVVLPAGRASLRIDAARWPTGIYVVRASYDGVVLSAPFTRR